MAVPCARCGREYDVALFAFGRTIDCTCGARVGVAPRVRPEPRAGDSPRLAADAMLGRLARWLRLLGLDVAWEPHVADAALVRRAIEEERLLLTRDRRLPEERRVPAVLVLRAEDPEAQLREATRALALAPHFRPFTRCSRCNAPLEDAPRDAVRARVPERVLAERERFRRCPDCGRIYWEGSHAERLLRRVERALGVPEGPR